MTQRIQGTSRVPEALPNAAPVPPANPLYAASDAQPELAEVIDLDDPRRLGYVRYQQWAINQLQLLRS